MIKEHSRNVAEIFTVNILKCAINFKKSNLRSVTSDRTPVNLIARWMPPVALFGMLTELLLLGKETEAKITDI